MKTCNKCGKPLDYWDVNAHFGYHTYMPYGSKHDGDMVDLHICIDCMDEFIDSCAIKPIMEFPENNFDALDE